MCKACGSFIIRNTQALLFMNQQKIGNVENKFPTGYGMYLSVNSFTSFF